MTANINAWLGGIVAEAVRDKLIELGECPTRPDHIAMQSCSAYVELPGSKTIPARIRIIIEPVTGSRIEGYVYVSAQREGRAAPNDGPPRDE